MVSIKNSNDTNRICPALELINTVKMELINCKSLTFENDICGFKFKTIRLYYDIKNTIVEQTNITTLLKEFIQPLNCNYAALDFVFDFKQRILAIVPLVFENEKYTKLNFIKNIKFFYYDCCELWIDMNKIQPTYSKRFNYIKKFKRKKLFMQKLLKIYINNLYPYTEINEYGKATYVYEYRLNDNGLAFKHISFDKLETFNFDSINRNSKFFISLAGAYTPGKYIDIGYYDAIEGNKFNITNDDIVFVIGFGAGLDLIHCLKNAKLAYGIEINLFGIISAKLNLKISKLQTKATIAWADMRQIVSNNLKIPQAFYGKITKLLWNIPYESIKPINNPVLLKDFFDNYSVLEWFIPYLYKNNAFAPNCKALLWKIVDKNNWIENSFQKYGFKILSYNDENICIVIFP